MADDRPVEMPPAVPEALVKENRMLRESLKTIEKAKKEWEQSMDCIDDIVIVIDLKDNVLRCNRMLSTITGKPYTEMLNRKWQDILKEGNFSHKIEDSGEIVMSHPSGRWFNYNLNIILNKETQSPAYAVITLNDITDIRRVTEELRRNKEALEDSNIAMSDAYKRLKDAQSQILQQEKMASIGQIAAGVAHEINNPIGFIMSNLSSLQKYMGRISEFIRIQSGAIAELAGPSEKDRPADSENILKRVNEARHAVKLDYITADVGNLVKESLDGAEKVKRIVQDLKSFSHVDQAEYNMADINAGIDTTINIVWNELKYKVTLRKEYGEIPLTSCNLGQLNQVFMNILVNAAQAIEKQGEITIKTWQEGSHIHISISDTGSGIPEDKINRIFEPFFTTKEIGKGTGLGLSIAYDIIKKHNGDIAVESKAGHGTTFTIKIPVVER